MDTVANLIDEHIAKLAKAKLHEQPAKVVNLMTEFNDEVKRLSAPQEEIATYFHELAYNPCDKNAYYWVIAAQNFPSSSYITPLCKILASEKECVWYEGIIYILEILKDERTIPYLEKVMYYNIPSDPWHSTGVASVKALAKIGTLKAITILQKAKHSQREKVRLEASYRLNQLNINSDDNKNTP